MSADVPGWLAGQHPAIPQAGAQAILALAEGGATVPFIARYRKEQTGNLDEVAIRAGASTPRSAGTSSSSGRPSSSRRSTRQGKLTPELEAQHPRDVRPRPRSRTSTCPTSRSGRPRPQTAREAGLEPLADWLWDCGHGAADAGRRDARGARGRVRRRGEGHRRRRRRAGGRGRHRDRAAVRGRGPAPAGAHARYFERGFARTRKGEKAKTAEPVRELLRLPGAGEASCSSRRARTATWPCGAAGWRRSWC